MFINNMYLLLEECSNWIIIAIFACFQFKYYFKTRIKLNSAEKFFAKKDWEVTEDNGIIQIKSSQSNTPFNKLVDELNEYILKNHGTTDFSIIQNKTESRVNVFINEALSTISFPVYWGLMGTFFGVAIGMWMFNDGIKASGSENMPIDKLIDGMLISMITSLLGLFLTTRNNAKAGKVRKEVDEDKGEFFAFLQNELLPHLGTSVVATLNSLRNTINLFEPAFRNVISDFESTFTECTQAFSNTFAENVTLVTSAVRTMGQNMSLINENVSRQEKLLNTLRQSSIINTLERFVEAANHFDSATHSIEKLEKTKEAIINSTQQLVIRQTEFNNSLMIPEEVLSKINQILNRITEFENGIKALGTSISQTQMLGNTEMNMIEEHLKVLRNKTNLAIQYQEIGDEHLQGLYDEQIRVIDGLNNKYRLAIEEHKDEFEKAMKSFEDSYIQIVAKCKEGVENKVNEFIQAIEKNLDIQDMNDKLAYLSKLKTMDDKLSYLYKLQSMDESLLNIKTIALGQDVIPELRKIESQIDVANVSLHEMRNKTKRMDYSKSLGEDSTLNEPQSKKRGIFSRLFKR